MHARFHLASSLAAPLFCAATLAAREASVYGDEDAAMRNAVQVESDSRKAARLLDRKRYADAKPLLEAIVAAAPRDASAWRKLGRCSLASGDAQRAVAAFNHQIKLGHKVESARFDLARSLALSGEKDRALDALESAIRLGYDSPKSMRRAREFAPIRSSKRFAKVVDLAARLSSMRKRACSLWSDEQWKAAIAAYEAQRDEMPDDGEVYHRLGFAEISDGQAASSEGSFRRQLELGHRTDLATYNLACAFSMQGKSDEALRWLDRSIDEGFDDHSQFRNDEDLASIRDGDTTRTRFDSIRRRLLDRLRTKAHAKVAVKLEDWDGAKALYTRMLDFSNDKKGAALCGLANAQYELGEFRAAARTLKSQIAARHKVPCALYKLACCSAKLGETDDGMDYIGDAMQLGACYSDLCDDEDLANLRKDARFLDVQRATVQVHVLRKFECETWQEVEAWARERIARKATDGKAWHRLGWAKMRQEQWPAAIEAFKKQEALGFKANIAILNLVGLHALRGDKDAAFAELGRLGKLSPCHISCLRKDADYASLRADSRFEPAMKKIEAASQSKRSSGACK